MATLSRIERGRLHNVCLKTLGGLAAAFGVEPAALLTEPAHAPEPPQEEQAFSADDSGPEAAE